jgi:hypothetical protein
MGFQDADRSSALAVSNTVKPSSSSDITVAIRTSVSSSTTRTTASLYAILFYPSLLWTCLFKRETE